MERVQKILSQAGLGSRRACEAYIEQGRVRVNGNVITLGAQADATKDLIEVDGEKLNFKTLKKRYFAFYKPANVLSSHTANHEDERLTVREMLPVEGHLFTIGRLDADSEGLMVLTNDGETTNQLAHPRYLHTKTYQVTVYGKLNQQDLDQWQDGVWLEEGRSAPCYVVVTDTTSDTTTLRVVMTEGKKRQIRRVASALGYPVKKLVRTHIGQLDLGKLKRGEWSELNTLQIQAMKTPAIELDYIKKRRQKIGIKRTPPVRTPRKTDGTQSKRPTVTKRKSTEGAKGNPKSENYVRRERPDNDERPPRRDGDERPPRRYSGDGDSRPPRRDGDERPPRRYSGDGDSRPPRRDGDSRPPRRDGDSRPPRRYSGDGDNENRPPRRDGDSRPPRRDGDSRPPRRDGDSRPPRRYSGDGDSRPPRRDGDERPPRRYSGDGEPRRYSGDGDSRPPRRDGDSRPPRRDGDERPPRRYSGDGDSRPPRRDGDSRPPRRYSGDGDSRPPRREGDERPPLKDGDSRPPRKPATGGIRRPSSSRRDNIKKDGRNPRPVRPPRSPKRDSTNHEDDIE